MLNREGNVSCQKGRLQSIVRRLKDRIALNRRAFILYSILRALVLVTLIRCIMTQRWEGVAISILVLVLFLVPSLVEGMTHIEIPGLFQAIIYSFIFAAEILGEIDHYYVLIPGTPSCTRSTAFSARPLASPLSTFSTDRARTSASPLSM